MRLLKSPNAWSCGLASLAMLFDRSFDEIVALLGHDGSQIVNCDLPEPRCRRAWHTQEFVDLAYKLGYAMVQVDGCPVFDDGSMPFPDFESRLFGYMEGNPGLILGRYSMTMWHMVAWDGEQVFDPWGPRQYRFGGPEEQITIDTFFPIYRIKS